MSKGLSDGSVLDETRKAVAAASHLTEADSGTVSVLLRLAAVIDGGLAPTDNVTAPTFLKYAAELGLTPLSRSRLGVKEEKDGGRLAELRAVRQSA